MIETSTPRLADFSGPERWWGHRCPLAVVADRLRGDPEQLVALVFVSRVWQLHRPHCAALEP